MAARGKAAEDNAAALQARVFAWLGDAETHGLKEPVRRIDTHAAVVFLAGPDAYKVKRAVTYPFLDFSTLDRREAACRAEIAVNAGNAPGLYLGVVPVCEAEDGRLSLGGTGKVVEWAVHLRRFDDGATLDRLAAGAPLGPALSDALAAVILAAHARAPRCDDLGMALHMRVILADTLADLRAAGAILPGGEVRAVAAALGAAFEEVEPLLLGRAAAGFLRRCHGDLHLGNIVLIEGAPVLFDAIEFDDRIATCDLLYDLAFLLMDLWERGYEADANRLFNRYLAGAEEPEAMIPGLAALPLFLALRAAIRAKVLAALARLAPPDAAGVPGTRAARYLSLAERFLAPAPPRLVAIGGLSGTGKTRLAAALAPVLGRAPGALHLRSDVIRKDYFGVPEQTRLEAAAYAPAVSVEVYRRMAARARAGLRAGQSVILDATHLAEAERAAAAALAAAEGVPFTGLWLEAPPGVLAARVAARMGDASDATEAVVIAQAARDTGPIHWQRLESGGDFAHLRAIALAAVGAGAGRASGV